MQTKKDWASHLQEKIAEAIKGASEKNWGYDPQNNWGFVFDLESMVHMRSHDTLIIKNKVVDATGITVYATVSKEITSLAEMKDTVYTLLGTEAEDLLVILPIIDQETVRYWFITGTNSHGHIGQIIIRREDIPQVELADADEIWTGGED